MNKKNILHRIFSGYWMKSRALFTLLSFVAAAAVMSAVIVLPLWFFATSAPGAYTVFCLVLGGLGIIWLLIRKGIRSRREEVLPEFRSGLRDSRRSFLVYAVKTLLTLFCLYILFYQFSSGALIRGIILFIVFFFFLGWLFFGGGYGGKKTDTN